jgi:hypothetical protein
MFFVFFRALDLLQHDWWKSMYSFWCVSTSHTFRPLFTLVNISACWADSMHCKVSRTRRKPLAVADRGLPSWAISPLTSSLNPHIMNSRAVFHRLRGDSKQHRCAFMISTHPTIKWSRRRLTMHANTHPPMFLECRTADDSIAQPHE